MITPLAAMAEVVLRGTRRDGIELILHCARSSLVLFDDHLLADGQVDSPIARRNKLLWPSARKKSAATRRLGHGCEMHSEGNLKLKCVTMMAICQSNQTMILTPTLDLVSTTPHGFVAGC